MKIKSSSDTPPTEHDGAARDRISFTAAFTRDETFPVPELVQALDADMDQVFYSSVSGETGAEYPPRAEMNAQVPPPAICVEVCHLLNQCLANCVDLHFQCKQAQWNVQGAQADTLVPLFQHTAASVEVYGDRIAARICELGGMPDGRLDSVAERSGLNRYPRNLVRDRQHVDTVASALGVTDVTLRADIAAMAKWCDTQTSSVLRECAVGIGQHLDVVEAQQQAMTPD